MQFTDEQRGPSGERRTPKWFANYMILAAETILKLDRKDSNGNALPLQERAEQILRAASGTRKIEPRYFQLAWLIAHSPAFAGAVSQTSGDYVEGQQIE
jgi:hypothetical protein